MKNVPFFPGRVWTGLSGERDTLLIDRPPQIEDWNQIVSEVISVESFLSENDNFYCLVPKTFLLGNNSPVTATNDKLDRFTVPGGSTSLLLRIRINAKIAPSGGSLSVQINIGGLPTGPYTLANGQDQVEYLNINTQFNSGSVITVDVLAADGTSQNVTYEMEFLTKAF